MLPCKLIHYFFSHPAAFGFQVFLPFDNITLNPANRKSNRVFLIFRLAVGGNSSVYVKGLPAVLEEMGRLVCSRG